MPMVHIQVWASKPSASYINAHLRRWQEGSAGSQASAMANPSPGPGPAAAALPWGSESVNRVLGLSFK